VGRLPWQLQHFQTPLKFRNWRQSLEIH
jgi:hypothetical protein